MPIPIIPLLAGAAELAPVAIKLFNRMFGGDDKIGKLAENATPQQIEEAVKQLPGEQAEIYAERLKAMVDAYSAETGRLEAEQGRVDAATLATLDPGTRGKVAYLRMTTRPRLVLRMSHVVMVPAYVLAVDAVFLLVKILFGAEVPLLSAALKEKGLIEGLYETAVWPATVIVLTYMTLRQIGKGKDDREDSAIAQAVSGVGGMISALKGMVKGK